MPDIKPAEDSNAQAVVEVLQDWLERAEAGEFKSVMMVAMCIDNKHSITWAGLGGIRHLEAVGLLELLKLELLLPPEED